MGVNIVQALVGGADVVVVQGVVNGVQGLIHAGVSLIPVLGPILSKVLGLLV